MTDPRFIEASERERRCNLEGPDSNPSQGEWYEHALAADRRIAELDTVKRLSVELDIADKLTSQLAEAWSLIDELAEQLIQHSATNGSAKIPSRMKANAVLAKVEAYRKDKA